MGLTIHYTLKTKQHAPFGEGHEQDNAKEVEQIVHKMRQLAMDLPFEEVGEVVNVAGKDCDFEARRAELQNGDAKNEGLFWLLIQAGKSVGCPWNKHMSRKLNPTRIIAFDTWPGPGSEAANFGLCHYPAEVEWEYRPEDDQRFEELTKSGVREFSWHRWKRCRKLDHYRPTHELRETRKVPTKLAGWHWGSFCKTQYSSGPKCGGIANFLRCHISVITLLDRIAKLPDLKVRVDDEGKYGPSTYSDDWKEAYDAGRKPIYRRHKGKYNPAALAQEVGEWNTMIAGVAGALSDALAAGGMKLEAPIKGFSDFEQLEFKGHNQKHLSPFLQAMAKLGKANAAGDLGPSD